MVAGVSFKLNPNQSDQSQTPDQSRAPTAHFSQRPGTPASRYKLEKEKHARPYTVEFDRDTSPSVAGWIIAVAGVVPLAIGCLVTCCALPRFLLSVCYKTAFDEEGQGDKEQEKKEKKDHEEQEKDKEENEDKKQAPHIEEKVSFFPKPSEPVPRLKESLLSMILNHWVTRYSLVGFFVSYTVATQINSVDLMSSNTYPSLLIDMVEGLLLCLLCCNVVFGQQAVFGKEAAEGNEILKLGDCTAFGTTFYFCGVSA